MFIPKATDQAAISGKVPVGMIKLAYDIEDSAIIVYDESGLVAKLSGTAIGQGAVIDCNANPDYPAAKDGDARRVSVAGKIGGASGVSVEAGDLLVCHTDAVTGDHATVGGSWYIIQVNIPDLQTIGIAKLMTDEIEEKTVDGGIKLGTTGKKIAFLGAAAIARKAAATTALTTITFTAPTPDYVVQDFVDSVTGAWAFKDKDEANTLLSVVANNQVRILELEAAIKDFGLSS